MAEPEAAVAVLHAAAPYDSILLMRRTERADDAWSGHWSFPGGRREPGDLDLLQTALRELEEECGIRLRPADLTCALPWRIAGRRVGTYLLVAPFVLGVAGELATVLHPLEAAGAAWLPLSMLRDTTRHLLRHVPGAPPEFWFPAVDLACTPLWGFTYRVIAEWLELGPRHDIFTIARDLIAALGLDCVWKGATAEVRGAIPVEQVRELLAGPGPHVLGLHRLELRPDLIRLTGPELEECVIRSV
jgi:8-oxo-dGTP pyrophosphatase MutT (NUDIX family)